MVTSFSENKAKTMIFMIVRQSIVKNKGIGGKRLEEIMVVIEKYLDIE